jgi:transcriptional repressor NrdR
LLKACEKRPVPTLALEAMVDAAESMLHDREDREISTQQIGAFVMERLRLLDPVAYVRFASVYRRFEDVGAFMDVVTPLLPSEKEG